MAAAALWRIGIFWVGIVWQPSLGLAQVVAFAAAPGGFVLLLMVAVLAKTRFLDDRIIDSQPFAARSREIITQQAMTNRVEQLALAAIL